MKHIPATPLPWRPVLCSCGHRGCRSGNVEPSVVKYQGAADMQDAIYIAHAANAYPKLVEALQRIADSHERLENQRGSMVGTLTANARNLLRELGEDV